MMRFSLALLALGLMGRAARAEAPAADFQLSLRPAGYQLALSDNAVSGNAFSAELVYRLTDPARSAWLVGGEVQYARTLACPGGNGGLCGSEFQGWLTGEYLFRLNAAWSVHSELQLGGGLSDVNQTGELLDARLGFGGELWLNPATALELRLSYALGAAFIPEPNYVPCFAGPCPQPPSTSQLYQQLGLQLGVRFGL
jgi:hypothetical protein